MVPSNIFDNLRMSIPRSKWVNSWGELIRLTNIPKADSVIITAGKQEPLLRWVPVKTISFSSMAQESQIWLYFVSVCAAVLEIVEDMDFSAHCLRSYDLM